MVTPLLIAPLQCTSHSCILPSAPIRDYRDTFAANKTAQGTFNHVLREHGILKSPAKIYPHLALSDADLAQTESAIQAAATALTE